MEMMGNIINSGAATAKAGANANRSQGEAILTEWISGAEAYINCKTRHNWSDDFASLNDDVKHILTDAAANLVGAHMITYDMSGFTTRVEAEDMINVLMFRFNQDMKLLEDQKTKDFISGE